MKTDKFEILAPIITPFYRGKFDFDSMKRLVNSLKYKVDAFIPCLSTGEGDKVSIIDWEKAIETVCASTKKPVFAGILRSNEKETLKFIKKANNLSCIGIVIPLTHSSIIKNLEYLRKVHALSDKPIIVYSTKNHPLSIRLVRCFSLMPKIIGIKDSSERLNFVKELINLRKMGLTKIRIFQGMENLLLESKGCDGYVLSLINTEPTLCRKMLKKHDSETNNIILEEFYKQNLGGWWYVTIKAILCQRGIIRSAEEIKL